MVIGSGEPWYVVQTEPQREVFVAKRLANDGFAPYLPRIKLPETGRVAALFPSYVFVGAADRWYAIKGCIGVRTILMSGLVPARLPARVVDEIRGREDRHGLVRLPPPPRHRNGDRVTIIGGMFADRIGVYVGMSGKDRERVLINMLGRQVAVDVPRHHLAPPLRRIS